MIYTSLAVRALSASALASPLSTPVHLHPKMPDTRINLSLYNKANGFRDVKIDGHSYTVPAHESLRVKAPAGTVIFADSRTPRFRRGDVMLQVTPQNDNQKIVIE